MSGPRLKGKTKAEIKTFCQTYYDKIASHLFAQKIILRLNQHIEAGQRVVIASASFVELLHIAGQKLGIKDILGTEIEYLDNRVSGNLTGVNCYGAGKLEKVNQFCQINNIDLKQSFFYSDSSSDLPLFESCGKPVVVNGSLKFRRWAKKKGWCVIRKL